MVKDTDIISGGCGSHDIYDIQTKKSKGFCPHVFVVAFFFLRTGRMHDSAS